MAESSPRRSSRAGRYQHEPSGYRAFYPAALPPDPALREQHRAAITEQLGRAAGNGHKVLESLFDRPIVSVAEVQALIGTTFVGANNIVSRLSGLGILHEVTGYARNRRFRYEPCVRLFSEAGAESQ